MKIKALRPQSYVTQLRCDRCHRHAAEGEWEFLEFMSVEYKAGYGSILGDGNGVAIDLCQHCLKEVLGPWLRITDLFDSDQDIQDDLDRSDPAKHGGEFTDTQETPEIDATHMESDESKSQSVAHRLNRKELDALVKFTHEPTCQGDIHLSTTPTGIGTALRATCSQNCRPAMDITDYSVW
jgi:hypothetical protein